MNITQENLDSYTFRRWWVRKYCRQIMGNPGYQPTKDQFIEYVDECIEKDEVI